jgi:hypothetical protein
MAIEGEEKIENECDSEDLNTKKSKEHGKILCRGYLQFLADHNAVVVQVVG